MDERLAEIARELDEAGQASELFDPEWRLVWVSDQLKTLLGDVDDERLGVGGHVIEARTNELWSGSATPESQVDWSRSNLPYILEETPADLFEGLNLPDLAPDDPRLAVDVEPRPAPRTWSYELGYLRPGFTEMRIRCVSLRLHDEDGTRIGTLNSYAPALPATVVDLLSRGDPEMFERMARLVEPGRHEAAILFADLQASGPLSKRLPSAAYFGLIRELTTAVDEVVGAQGGVVGKHAGDGVTAFFLVEEDRTASGAARAAVEAARAIGEAARRVAGEIEAVDAADVLMNVGVHWSGALYMGQVVTGGRLEVTALGDEMNECARLQASARDGAVLAAKALVEQLAADDAAALGIDPDRVAYRTLAELPGASEKAVRDAGSLAVAELISPRASG